MLNVELIKITNKATGAVIGYYDGTKAYGDVVELPHDAALPNSYYYPDGFFITLGVNNMPVEGVDVEIKVGEPAAAVIKLGKDFKVLDSDGNPIKDKEGKDITNLDKILRVYGASYNQDMSAGFERKADVGATENIAIGSEGEKLSLVLTSIKYKDADGTHYVEAVNGVCSFTVPKGEVEIIEAKTLYNYVRSADIKTSLSNVTVKFYYPDDNTKEAYFYLLNEEVWFRLTVSNNYTLESLKVVNLDDGSEITYTDKGNGYYAFTLTSRNIRIEANATNLRYLDFAALLPGLEGKATVKSGANTWDLDTVSNGNKVYVANAGDKVTVLIDKATWDASGKTQLTVAGVAYAGTPSGDNYSFTLPVPAGLYNDAVVVGTV